MHLDLDLMKTVDEEDVVHLHWPHSRSTLCEIDKRYRPYPKDWGAPVTCEHCFNAWMATVVQEAARLAGRPMVTKHRREAAA